MKRGHLLVIILLLLIIVPTFMNTLQKGYFSMHDDLQTIRLLVMDKCVNDGQFPCRWSVDLGYGYGYPLFNYYPPLPYYIAEVFHKTGLSFLDSIKAIIVVEFIGAALSMYLLAQEFWGKWGGFVSAVAYSYAPYHAVDIYVRGAIDESYALIWFPAVYWAVYKVISECKGRYVVLLSLFTAGLMLSHNPMLMVYSFGALLWTGFWLFRTKNYRSLKYLIVGGVWAFCLAAFFTLPVLLEQKYAHVETLVEGYFNYLAHFADLNQLFFSRFWGYGGSILGPNDGLSFQIGYLHWGGALVSLIVAGLLFKHKKTNQSLMILLIFGLDVIYTFMTHQRSAFIWDKIQPLEYLQFPWRFLALTIFESSLLLGSIVYIFNNPKVQKLKIPVTVLLVLGIIFLYKDYFHWDKYYPNMTDQEKFSGKNWQLQVTGSIFDYLPKSAPLPPPDPSPGDVQFIKGSGKVLSETKNSIYQKYQINATSSATLQLNTFYFPGWQYYLDNQQVSSPPLDKDLGVPEFNLTPGTHQLVAQFINTPVRLIANYLSLLGWLSLLLILPLHKKRWF